MGKQTLLQTSSSHHQAWAEGTGEGQRGRADKGSVLGSGLSQESPGQECALGNVPAQGWHSLRLQEHLAGLQFGVFLCHPSCSFVAGLAELSASGSGMPAGILELETLVHSKNWWAHEWDKGNHQGSGQGS